MKRFVTILIVGTLGYLFVHLTTGSMISGSKADGAYPIEQEEVSCRSNRLASAREARQAGDYELAIHEYLCSIQRDQATAGEAIEEMVGIFLSRVKAYGEQEKYVEQSAQISRCYQILLQLKQADSSTLELPKPARNKLFEQIQKVHAAGNEAVKFHLETADQLRTEAKGFWNDDEEKQAEALHRVNLAWSCYPLHPDDELVKKMYEIWADMKSELATWQYNQVMEEDRLRLGCVIGPP